MSAEADGKYYAYIWLDEAGEPFYVGKGCSNRALAHVKRDDWPLGAKTVRVIPCSSEAEALGMEALLYKRLSKFGAKLLNKKEPTAWGFWPDDLRGFHCRLERELGVKETWHQQTRLRFLDDDRKVYKAFGVKMSGEELVTHVRRAAMEYGYSFVTGGLSSRPGKRRWADIDGEAMDKLYEGMVDAVDVNAGWSDRDPRPLQTLAEWAIDWAGTRDRVKNEKELVETRDRLRAAQKYWTV